MPAEGTTPTNNSGYQPAEPAATAKPTDRKERIRREEDNPDKEAALKKADPDGNRKDWNRPRTDAKPAARAVGTPEIAVPKIPGYLPNKTKLPSGDVPNKSIYQPNSRTYLPDSKTYKPDSKPGAGYMPKGKKRAVGYRPVQYQRPKGYLPPRLEEGRWHYSPPSIVDPYRDWRPSRPYHYGHWAFRFHHGYSWRSCYSDFSIFPYVEVTQIEEPPVEVVEYVTEPIYATAGSFYDEEPYNQLDETLSDIRGAWVGKRFDLIERHVQLETRIAVLSDGIYDYTISSEDYLAMTQDAIEELQTVSFKWNKVRERSDGSITAYGQHSCRFPDRVLTVFVSYTLEKIEEQYYITEVGSSLTPIKQENILVPAAWHKSSSTASE